MNIGNLRLNNTALQVHNLQTFGNGYKKLHNISESSINTVDFYYKGSIIPAHTSSGKVNLQHVDRASTNHNSDSVGIENTKISSKYEIPIIKNINNFLEICQILFKSDKKSNVVANDDPILKVNKWVG